MYQENDKKFGSRSIISGVIWKTLERGSSLLVTMLINIVLARLLDPASHGLLSMVTVFVTLLQIFVTAGIGAALVQKKDADNLDFSTMFWSNLVISTVLYTVLFIAAPGIAQYFGQPELALILRVLSLQLFFAGINSIQRAYISRHMLFRHYFYSTFSAKVLSGILGVALAFVGAGVWALVAQSVSLIMLECIILWFRVQWRPTMQFSWQRGKALYGFTFKMMLSSFLSHFMSEVRSLIIGKRYTASALAFYGKGFLFPNCIMSNVSSSLGAVMYPVLSSKQSNLNSVKSATRQWIAIFGFAMLPVMVGMGVVADVLIPVLLTDKWAPSIPYLKIACVVYAIHVITTPIHEAIKAIGKANVCLWMQIINISCSVLSLLLTYKQGVYIMAMSFLVTGSIHVVISLYCGWKYLGYTLKEVVADVLPTALLCAVMAVGVLCVAQLISNRLICLVVQVLVGVVIYVGAAILTKNKNFYYVINLLKGYVKH